MSTGEYDDEGWVILPQPAHAKLTFPDLTDRWTGDDSVKVGIDLSDVIRDFTRKVFEMEEQGRLHVLIEYLRKKGYTVTPPPQAFPDGDLRHPLDMD